eukprot:scaffold81003_cov59-Attheya_sp.AAC.2
MHFGPYGGHKVEVTGLRGDWTGAAERLPKRLFAVISYSDVSGFDSMDCADVFDNADDFVKPSQFTPISAHVE